MAVEIERVSRNNSIKMASREYFLSAFEDTLSDKLFINYYFNETTGFSISLGDVKNVACKIHELFSKTLGSGFQFIGVALSDYVWLPCILLSIWKSGSAGACIGTQYAEEHYSNFMNFLNVKYLITDKEEIFSNADVIDVFRINNSKFYVMKRELQSVMGTERANNYRKADSDICYGIMTSGSTGTPKIIQVPWSCILPNACELISLLSISIDDNVSLLTPCTFDPFFIELLISMLVGCKLTIVSPSLKISSRALLKVLFEFGTYSYEEQVVEDQAMTTIRCKTSKISNTSVTVLQMTPSVFMRWSSSDIKNFILSDDSSLRILLLGGETFPKGILNLKSNNNKTQIFNLYGITEISCWAFINNVTECSEEISLGNPLKDIIYKINENNELLIGSKKRKCIIDFEENLESDEVVFRRTGDLIKKKNDKIYYICRTSQLVKKFGIKINLGEIEKNFLNSQKHIFECVCIFDENVSKIALFYTSNNLSQEYLVISGKDENKIVKELTVNTIEIPDYIIEIPKIPLNNNGKCDRKVLLSLLTRIRATKIDIVPDIKASFRKVWATFVNGDNFVRSGGDSVRALHIITRLGEEGIILPNKFLELLLRDGDYDTCLNFLISDPYVSTSVQENKKPENLESKTSNFYISWKFDTKKCVDAPPAVYNYHGVAHAVVGSHSFVLSSVRINTGEENWSINLGDRIESGLCIDRSSTFGVIGCYDHHVYCISLAGGDIIWKYKTGGMIKSTPCLSTDEKMVFVPSYDTYLYCLDFRSGALVAKLKLSDRGVFGSGTTSDALLALYIATLDGTCLSINQETQSVNWRHRLDSPVFASPLVINDEINISVVFAEVIGRVHFFDAKTGNKIWYFESNGYIYSTPVCTSKFVIFGCYDSHLYCLRFPVNPGLQWKVQMDSPLFAKPCFFPVDENFLIVVASTKGWIYLCHSESGKKLTEIKLDGEIFSSPKPYLDNLLLGCRDNYFYCFKIVRPSELLL